MNYGSHNEIMLVHFGQKKLVGIWKKVKFMMYRQKYRDKEKTNGGIPKMYISKNLDLISKLGLNETCSKR